MSFINKYWFLILLAMVATLLGVIWATSQGKKVSPQKTTLNKPVLPGNPLVSPINFTFDTQTTLPNESPILTIKKKSAYTRPDAERIAKALEFTSQATTAQDVVDGPIVSWTQEDKFLSVTLNSRQVNFDRNLELLNLTSEGTFLDSQSLNLKISSVFANLGISAGLQNLNQITNFITVDVHSPIPIITSEENSLLKEILYSYQYDNKTFINPSGGDFLARVWVDKRGEIVKIESFETVASLTPSQNLKIRNMDEIKSTINKEGALFAIKDFEFAADPGIFSSITITKLEVAFLIPAKDDIAQPVFRLEGIGFGSSIQAAEVVLFLPALSSEYYKN